MLSPENPELGALIDAHIDLVDAMLDAENKAMRRRIVDDLADELCNAVDELRTTFTAMGDLALNITTGPVVYSSLHRERQALSYTASKSLLPSLSEAAQRLTLAQSLYEHM